MQNLRSFMWFIAISQEKCCRRTACCALGNQPVAPAQTKKDVNFEIQCKQTKDSILLIHVGGDLRVDPIFKGKHKAHCLKTFIYRTQHAVSLRHIDGIFHVYTILCGGNLLSLPSYILILNKRSCLQKCLTFFLRGLKPSVINF